MYLKRLSVGSFFHKDAILLADIAKLVDKAKTFKFLRPLSFVLDDIPAIDISRDEAFLLSRGQKIYKENMILEEEKYKNEVYITCNNSPVALARIKNKYILPFRIFNN